MTDTAAPDDAKRQRRYERKIRFRLRIANVSLLLRAGGLPVIWLVVVVAGAAVPLSEAIIEEGWEWVTPTLGFVVVVAAGLERIVSRTTGAAVALDELRRSLTRERRRRLAAVDEYADATTSFAVYVRTAEELFRTYDERMVEHNKTAAKAGDAAS